MCFFKKKPKFDWDDVQVKIANALADLDFKGIPEQRERCAENWKLEMSNDEYGVGGYLTLTEGDFSWTICMYFSKSFNDLGGSLAFKNCKLSDKHMSELRSKYPFLEIRTSANNTIDVDYKAKEGKYRADGIRCKKIDDIAPAVAKHGEYFAYLCVYDTVKRFFEEEKAGK